jgi:molecular chaperone DnaJ
LGSYGKGDQLVQVLIETPAHLNSEQKEILKKFSQIEKDSTHPKHSDFFRRVKNIFGS